MAPKKILNAHPDPETFIPDFSSVNIPCSESPKFYPARGSVCDRTDITAAFTELIREGKVCQYQLLLKAKIAAFTSVRSPAGSWKTAQLAFNKELDRLTHSYTLDGGNATYGDTLKRALRTWIAVVERLRTEEEAFAEDERCKAWDEKVERNAPELLKFTAQHYELNRSRRDGVDLGKVGLRSYRVQCFGLPDMTDSQLLKHYARNPLPRWYRTGLPVTDHLSIKGPEDLPAGAAIMASEFVGTTGEIHGKWVAEFAAEVEVCIEHFKERDELPGELQRLVSELKDFEVCAGEGRPFVEQLRTTGTGLDVLSKIQHVKNRLLTALEGLLHEHHVINLGVQHGLKWKGTTGELCELIHLLVDNNWIEEPKSRTILAKRVHGMFHKGEGQPLDLGSVTQGLKLSGYRSVRAGVEFDITRNPKEK